VKIASFLARLVGMIDDELPEAVRLRERLHAVPETGYAETQTARLVAEAMEEPGTSVAGTGAVYRVGSRQGPGVGVRAELDGLSITEQTGAEFAARNGCMHACGHDVHLAALVALTRAVRRIASALPAPLVAICQPSEERIPSGALALSREEQVAHLLDTVVAAHVHPELPWGSVGVEPGVVNAADDVAEIVIEGVAGHGAYPHKARDPVLALAHAVVALHGIVGRRIDPTHGAAITVGKLLAGTAENVIPAQAHAWATIRALDATDQRLLREAVIEVVTGVAQAHGCAGSVRYTEGEPPLRNDARLAAMAQRLASGAGLRVAAPWRSCGSDDFAHLSRFGPLLMAFVGLRGAPGFVDVPLHHPRFLPPREAVGAVARAQALAYVSGCAART
jgi:amidohydrolase